MDISGNRLQRVLVTGISGMVGAHVARELLAHGYTVRGLDRSPLPADLQDKVEMVYADLVDGLAMLRAVDGCDGIAHLGAIPHPRVPNADQIISVNVVGTQHLLDAAEKFGVKRFVLASSCCTLGIFFALHPIDPQYLPVDENHPLLPQDMYGLSKVFGEELCAAYTRRSGMTTVSLRLTTVMDFGREHFREWMRHSISGDGDRRNDLWTYIEARDTARAFRLALENAPEGQFTPLIISARDSYSAHDIRHLVGRHFPALAGHVTDIAPSDALYDTRRAEEAIGFVAENSWRDIAEFADIAVGK